MTCGQCGTGFEARSPRARFCSPKCRKAAFTARHNKVPAVAERRGTAGTTVEACRAELEAAGRAEGYLGRAALALAARIDASTAVMGFAALVRELRATMDAALEGVQAAADPVDELRARRDRLRAAAGAS